MATYKLPTDKDLLAALGTIALRHGQLENSMKMVIQDLAGVEKHEALNATARQNSGELRQRIRKLAKQRLGEGNALVKIDALLRRAELAADKRNELLHSVWGTDRIFGTAVRDENHTFKTAPDVRELESVDAEIMDLLHEFIEARLHGFLFEALQNESVAAPAKDTA